MRKIKYAIVWILMPILLGSCFSDDGNYKYESLKPPTWLIDVSSKPIQIVGRGGSNTKIDASKVFNWGSLDSLQRSQEVRYEWRYNGKVFSDKLTEIIPTEEFLKRLGLEDYPTESYLNGDFAIIEKSTGVSFKAKTTIFLYPPIADGDFIVYSVKSPDTPNVGALSVMSLRYGRDASGKFTVPDFKLKPNQAGDIPGTPKQLDVAFAKNVSKTGSITVTTQEGDASVFDASTLKKVWDLSSRFADGTPTDFKVSARRDQEVGGSESPAFTWVATQDGRVFSRQMSKNYLGGKFLTEPYYLDEKGYKITSFGHTCWGITNIPCYDEKNRRVVIATSLEGTYGSYRSWMTTLSYPNWQGAPIMEMPEDAEVLFLTNINGAQYFDHNNSWFQIYYNTGGKSMVGTFTIDNRGRRLNIPMAYTYYFPYEVAGHHLNKDTKFLVAAGERITNRLKAYYDLFSEDKEVYAIVRGSTWASSTVRIEKLPLEGITSKITFITYDRETAYVDVMDYPHLIVGCENGDILIYNVVDLPAPRFLKKYNVSGKVVSIKQLGVISAYYDMY